MDMNSKNFVKFQTEKFQNETYGMPYEIHYFNGQLEKKGFLRNGLSNGPYISYHHNGQVGEKCVFKDGVLDGPYESYYPNGQMEMKCTFKNGMLDGEYEEYDRRGNLLTKGAYRNNRFISDDELCARQKINQRLKEIDETEPPTVARRLVKRTEVLNFRTLFPKSNER